jgi:hypothetical protein
LPVRPALWIIALVSAASTARAESVQASTSRSPAWYGLSPTVALTDQSGVNFEPESYQDTLTAGFGVRWAMGKMVAPASFFDPLTATLSMDVTGEITGYGEDFRTNGGEGGGGQPSTLGGTVPEYEPVSSECQRLINEGGDVPSDCYPRDISGAPKRLNYSDLSLTLAHGKLATLPGEVDLSGNVRAVFPTSLASRNNELYLRTSYGLGLSRAFLHDKLGVSYGVSFAKNFYRYETRTVAATEDPLEFNGARVDGAANDAENVKANTSFSVTNSLGLSYGLPHDLLASTSYALTDNWSYDLSNECVIENPTTGLPVDVCQDTNEVSAGAALEGRALKANQVFSLGLRWAARDWVSLALAMTTSSPVRKPDSSDFNNPFFHGDRNGYTSVSLGATFTLDKLYANVF